jgi:hypothetical protein
MKISAENTKGACPMELDSRKIQSKEQSDTVYSYGLCRRLEEFTTGTHFHLKRS